MSHNPLIDYPDLPPFSEIRPEHVKPAVEQLVEAGRERIRKVLADGDFSYRALELTLSEEDERLEKAFGPVGHLNGVAQNDALREAYNACLPLISEYSTEVGQNSDLFAAYQALRDSDEFKTLTPAQRKDIDNTLRDFRLSGVALPEAQKAQYMDNAKRLSELTTRFENNLLDATQGSLIVALSDFYQRDDEWLDLLQRLATGNREVLALCLECDDEIELNLEADVHVRPVNGWRPPERETAIRNLG